MLNRVREKSQEEAIRRKNLKDEKYNIYKSDHDSTDSDSRKKRENLIKREKNNELLISTNITNLEITPNSHHYSNHNHNEYSNQIKNKSNSGIYAMSALNSLISMPLHTNNINSNRQMLEEEDEQLISILNSNSNRNMITSQRKQCDLKDSTVDAKADFYDDNLFDLIEQMEEMESKDKFFIQKKEILNNQEKVNKKQLKQEEKINMFLDYDIHKEYERKF